MSSIVDYELLVPRFDQGAMIPKSIYQTCKDKTALNVDIQQNIAYLKRINPGWTYRLYDDADIEVFIREEYGVQILGYYYRINPIYGAARADFFRYLLIYRYGGVYLDIKSSLARPLDQILRLDDRYILGYWDNLVGQPHEEFGLHQELIEAFPRGEYQQYYICGAVGHPFLRAVILQVLRNIDSYDVFKTQVGPMGVFRTTGPIAYSLAIASVLDREPCVPYRLVDNSADNLGIVYSIFEQEDTLAIGKHRQHVSGNRHYTQIDEPIVLGGHPIYLLLYRVYLKCRPWVASLKQRFL